MDMTITKQRCLKFPLPCHSLIRIFALCWLTFSIFLHHIPACYSRSLTKTDNEPTSLKDPAWTRSKNYIIVVDAGSSGSRAFVYEYQFKPTARLGRFPSDPDEISINNLHVKMATDSETGKELVKKIQPGISSFANNVSFAAEYLFGLLDPIVEKLPHDRVEGIPLYILATAGLRLVSPEAQQAILNDVRRDVAAKYPFLYFPPSHVRIITGKMEGIYAWITFNFLLENFENREKTVGILEIGGASVQIAYQIPQNYTSNLVSIIRENNPNEDVSLVKQILKNMTYEINLAGTDAPAEVRKRNLYEVFVYSFLGLGANQMVKQHEKLLYLRSLENKRPNSYKSTGSLTKVKDPCFNPDYSFILRTVAATGKTDDTSTGGIRVRGSGNFDKCVASLFALLRTQEPCPISPCSLDGIHSPRRFFIKNGTDDDEGIIHPVFYGISELYHITQDIFDIGDTYDPDLLREKASKFCEQDIAPWLDDDPKTLSARYQNLHLIQKCIKSAWAYTLLKNGLKFNEKVTLKFAHIINGKEARWTLGAAIYAILNDLK